MQTELDDCEKVIGTWNPANRFSSIYDTLDQIHDEIDEFNHNNEDSKMAPTPSSNAVPPTPGGSRRGTSIANKAKQFNTDLHQLQGKFQAMEDVTYDQQKIALVYDITERSLEQKKHLEAIVERLNVLENMHKESPNIE